MIKSITITNYLGESITMELTRPEKSGFVVHSIKGLGPGKAIINTVEVSTNDGGLYNSSRMPIRNIVLSLDFFYDGTTPIEEIRYKSYKYFPVKKKVRLLIETDNRKASIDGYVESNEPNIFSKLEGTNISILCPNPYFQSAGENGLVSTVFYGIDPSFEFPFENDSLYDNLIEFGNINNHTEKVVTYDGDSETGVTITIHAIGEVGSVTIYNTGTRETMFIDANKLQVFTGSGIVAGDDIIICTVKGQKSIALNRSGKIINILNCLGRGSSWFQLAKGDNVFAYTSEFGSQNLQFKIENRVLYEGV